jgi:hypothetical protein
MAKAMTLARSDVRACAVCIRGAARPASGLSNSRFALRYAATAPAERSELRLGRGISGPSLG